MRLVLTGPVIRRRLALCMAAFFTLLTALAGRLFITGDRPMEEFSSYLKELEDNGLTELNNYYVEAYQNYLNAL